MVQFVFTPWRNRAELLKVRSQLYPSSSQATPPTPPTPHQKWTASELQDIQRAVARVFMWVHRGNCPHVVESTAMLMSALLLDRRHTRRGVHHQGENDSEDGSTPYDEDDAASEYGVRAAYLTAFTRFVTGLLDGHQDRARKLSMYGVAKTVGLPAGFVELRHQGTHEPMPGLAQLRPAAGRALVWIWEYYWRNLPEAEEDHGPGRGNEGMGEVAVGGGASSREAAAPGAAAGLGGAADGKRRPVVVAASATSTIKGRMCRAALMGYLQRQEGEVGGDAAKQALTRQLGQWDDALVLRTLEDIGQTARDVGILSRSVKLSREVLLRATGDEAQQGDDKEIPTDAEEMRRELREAREEAESLVDGGKRKRDDGDDDGPGWKRWKGPWASRPIGIL